MAQIVDGINIDEIMGVVAQQFWACGQYGPHALAKYDTLGGKLAAPLRLAE